MQECQDRLHFSKRIASDLNDVSNLLCKPDSSVQASSIKDCVRLGKYSSSNACPRPILVKFNSYPAVMSVLANRPCYAPYIVKPDLSPLERANEKVLLKERWNLCQLGVEKSSIKIKGNSLFVNGQLFGKVSNNSKFNIVCN